MYTQPKDLYRIVILILVLAMYILGKHMRCVTERECRLCSFFLLPPGFAPQCRSFTKLLYVPEQHVPALSARSKSTYNPSSSICTKNEVFLPNVTTNIVLFVNNIKSSFDVYKLAKLLGPVTSTNVCVLKTLKTLI